MLRRQEDRCSPASIASEILASPDPCARLRHLARLGRDLCSKLVPEFVDRAQAEIRRDPREAARIARIGAQIACAADEASGRVACLSTRAQAALIRGQYHTALRAADVAFTVCRDGQHGALIIVCR